MNQMKAFIEKARNDSELMAKIDELGAAGAGTDKIIALAATYGFAFKPEDFRQAAGKAGELNEEALEAATGGNAPQFTKNRYDPAVCSTYKECGYNCIGPFWGAVSCDHYRTDTIKNAQGKPLGWRKYCVMGFFDYDYMHQ